MTTRTCHGGDEVIGQRGERGVVEDRRRRQLSAVLNRDRVP